MHKVFKPKKTGDKLNYCTMYSDGHVVAWFERWIHDTSSRVQYVKIAESIGVRAKFEGYVSFRDAALLIAIAGLPNAWIETTEASVESGSDNTRALGLAIGGLTVHSGAGYFHLSSLPKLLSCAWQAGETRTAQTFAQAISDEERFATFGANVVEIYRAEQKAA